MSSCILSPVQTMSRGSCPASMLVGVTFESQRTVIAAVVQSALNVVAFRSAIGWRLYFWFGNLDSEKVDRREYGHTCLSFGLANGQLS